MNTGNPQLQPRTGPTPRSILPSALVLALTLTLAGLLFVLTAWRASAPPPNLVMPDQESVAKARFSAAKAQETLSYLLRDRVPHPMGSDANRRVKDRVIEKLRETGVAVEVQHALGCSEGAPHCGFVENVIGTLPGDTDDTIVLMAHYDSTTNSPGAGDDGAGVAAVIETVRLLAAEARRRGNPYRNSIQAVITDGEEEGLFGAEAFFAEYPGASNTRTLINIEGSGSAGPSNLLRSSPGSGDLVTLYRQTAPHPMASSIATEIFERMPNDTDFSVAMRAGVKGLDFAFAGERTHYHTPLDTVENLNLGTLQHHGDNILPLLRELAEVDLTSIDGEYSYTTMFDIWLQWRESLSLPLACLGALLLLISIFTRRRIVSVARTALGIVAALVILVFTIVCCVAALMIAQRLAGGMPGWPGTIWPWRLMLLSAATLGTCLSGAPIARRLGFHAMLNGAWFWIAVLSLSAAAVAPLAASPFLVPLLVMACLAVIVSLIDREGDSVGWLIVAIAGALAAVVYLGGLIPLLEESQGYELAPAFYVPLALCLLLLTPLFSLSHGARDTRGDGESRLPTRWLVVACTLALLVAAIGLLTTPLYTEARPRQVSLRYVQDLDRGTAKWWALANPPLPSAMSQVVDFEYQEAIVPGLPNSGLVATAKFEPWPGATSSYDDTLSETDENSQTDETGGQTLEVLHDESTVEGRQVTLRLRSLRGSTVLRLAIDRRSELTSVEIAGRNASHLPTGSPTREYDLISVFAPPADGVEVVLGLGSRERHEHIVMDVDLELPESAAPLLEARSPLAGPAHSGDRWMAIQRVSF
jgi:hypothetical protein